MPEWVISLLAHPSVAAMLRLVLLALLFLLVRRALQVAVRRLEGRLARTVEEPDRRMRLNTLLHAAYGVAVVIVGVITLAMFLEAMGVYIGPLLASAGVAGLAISLGAQTLIRDYIGGILILVEDHFRVGDVIEVNTVAGEVTRITLRVTYLRNLEGKLHAVPNGDIRTVTNLTREWSRAVVDLTLESGTAPEALQRALAAAMARLQADPAVKDTLLSPPEVYQWNSHTGPGRQVRIMVKTLPGQHWQAGRILRQLALEALQSEGLQLAGPATIVQGEHIGA